MASWLQFLSVLSLQWLIIIIGCSSSNEIPKRYIVYMGSSTLSNGTAEDVEAAELAHLKLLSSIIPSEESERISIIHHYYHAFKGFTAMLTDKEASALSGISIMFFDTPKLLSSKTFGHVFITASRYDDVVSVFPDPVLKLHTTRSWDFLHLQPATSFWFNHTYRKLYRPSDVIIGVIDSGIWPESESFKDTGMSEIPSRWKGICMESADFKKSQCNRKLIGARYYTIESNTSELYRESPRDCCGHGTHVASTAAGAHVANASYYGLAKGTARGGSPLSRIASYKVCVSNGRCDGSAIMQAFDHAIRDGVDIISLSMGDERPFAVPFLIDPIAIGALHAEKMGIMVVCSGGNEGPRPYTVGNTAPWVFTVAATTIDRDFQSTVLLGNGKSFQGASIHFSNSPSKSAYPLAFGKDVAVNLTTVSEARRCHTGSLDPKKVAGKIIVCYGGDPIRDTRGHKVNAAITAEAKGLILVSEEQKGWTIESGIFPYVEVGKIVGSQIIKYISSTKNPTATILPTVDVPRYKPAPVVAYFSSRGPGLLTENIIKPDVAAPGVNILAASIPSYLIAPLGPQKPQNFALESGTSQACPHVSGAAAFIRSVHHRWTSSMIKSALMTTATAYDNLRKPMTNNTGHYANPHDMGAGEINPLKALNPGLVFKTTMKDYLNFLCYYNAGYPEKIIQALSEGKHECTAKSSEKLISNINYPSISISKLNRGGGVRIVRRTATNVGLPNATYIARVHAPSGLLVKVLPERIAFTSSRKKVSFKVAFYSKKEASGGYKFGSITWLDGRHSVRMVFAVKVE